MSEVAETSPGPVPVPQPGTVLVLRTCSAGMTSWGGFRWPESGLCVAPDWNPEPRCGHGLHALLWGEGDGGLLDWSPGAKWLVVRVQADQIVNLRDKVKFPAGLVVFCGTRQDATAYLAANGGAGKAIVGGTATAGDRGTATAGYRGTATAGDSGTATAGDRGTATAGDSGTATAGDRGTATAGYRGTATAGHRGTATAGHRGTATAGHSGTATAGEEGVIVIRWWDPDKNRWRLAIGQVGEDGIVADTPYRVENGRLVPAEPLQPATPAAASETATTATPAPENTTP